MLIEAISPGRRRGTRRPRAAPCWRIAILTIALLAATGPTAWAQCAFSCGPPPPVPAPVPVPATSDAIGAGADYALFGLGTRYLQSLVGRGGPTAQGSLFGTGPNPGGGGAPAPPAGPTYRAWSELYGQSSQTGAQPSYPGDSRRTAGGVAGLAMTVAPGAMLGLSVDQSRTWMDIAGLPQHANFDLTQFGVNGAYEMGAWTFSAAGVTGIARIRSDRDTSSGPATAAYDAALWGVIGEAAYTIALGSARVVPKFGADWTRTRADPYAESGGIDAVTVPSATADRTRLFAGAEVGNTWIAAGTVLDLSGYVRVVDIVSQHVPALTVSAVSGPATPVTVFGVTESKYGLDTGATASVRLSAIARLYAVYDGRFRDGYQSHTGTLGVEFRW